VSHWKAGSHAVISHAGERNIKEHTAEIAHSRARHLTGGGNRTWCYVAPPYRVQANRPSRLYVLETVVSLANRTTHGGISDSSMWTLPCYRRESPCQEHLSRWCRNPSVVVSVSWYVVIAVIPLRVPIWKTPISLVQASSSGGISNFSIVNSLCHHGESTRSEELSR
jgi:hypothetical protein